MFCPKVSFIERHISGINSLKRMPINKVEFRSPNPFKKMCTLSHKTIQICKRKAFNKSISQTFIFKVISKEIFCYNYKRYRYSSITFI